MRRHEVFMASLVPRKVDPYFDALTKSLRERLAQDWDFCIVLTGLEGSGKSSLALQLATAVQPDFGLDSVVWDVDQAVQKAIELEPTNCLVLDEAFDAAFNRQAMAKTNKKWVKFLGTARARNLGIFVCFPRFENLDPYTRKHRATHWIHVLDRGIAVLRMRTENYGHDSAWAMKLALRYGPADYLPFYPAYRQRKLDEVSKQGKESASKKSL